MKSLKLSKAEAKTASGPCKPMGVDGPRYPYGTRITLDKEALTKLGLTPKSFDVGQRVTVEAVGVIKSLRSAEGDTYESSSIEIQLQSLGVEGQSKSAVDAMSKGVKDADSDG